MDSFYCMRFYVTYRCNSRCGYCNVWQEPSFRHTEELSLEEGKELIHQCYNAGIRFIDFTGGEPTLCPHLPQWISFAKSLGIKTEITTNAVVSPGQTLNEAFTLADKCNVSLDTLDSERYRRIRGIDQHESVLSTLDKIKIIRQDAGMNPPRIVMTLSQGNEADLPGMIAFAQKMGVELYLNPMFPFFSGQISGDQAKFASQIVSAVYAPNTVVMLHFVEFCTTQAEKDRPSCSANRQTLTFAPDGSLILPCYHAMETSVSWTGNLAQILDTSRFQRCWVHSQTSDRCKTCTVTPYFGISFNRRLNRFFLIQSYSEKLNHLKRDFLNHVPEWTIPGERLFPLLEVLRQTAASYPADDSRDQDCWQLENVPHFGFDRIKKSVYVPAFEMWKQQPRECLMTLFCEAAEFQLRWWIHYLQMHMGAAVLMSPEENRLWLGSYFQLLSQQCKIHHWNEGIDAVDFCNNLL